MNQEKIGKFIKTERKKKNLTQEELASILEVTDKAVSKWENGRCLPDVSLFTKLCKALDITVNELLNGEKLNKDNYQEKTEEITINLMKKIKKNKKRYIKITIIMFVLFFLITLLINVIPYFELAVPYDNRIMKCHIDNDELVFEVAGLSVINEYYVLIESEKEDVYFFTTKIYLSNKQRSHFEAWDSMAKLIDGKNLSFGYYHKLDIDKAKKVKVYHTDTSLDQIKNANKKELEEIIKKSNLMCEREEL